MKRNILRTTHVNIIIMIIMCSIYAIVIVFQLARDVNERRISESECAARGENHLLLDKVRIHYMHDL